MTFTARLAGRIRDYQITSRLIPEQIKECNHQLSMIGMQLDILERQAMNQAHQEKQQGQPEPDSARQHITGEHQRREALENRLTETGIGLLTRQAPQEPSGQQGESRYDGLYDSEKGCYAQRQQPRHREQQHAI